MSSESHEPPHCTWLTESHTRAFQANKYREIDGLDFESLGALMLAENLLLRRYSVTLAKLLHGQLRAVNPDSCGNMLTRNAIDATKVVDHSEVHVHLRDCVK